MSDWSEKESLGPLAPDGQKRGKPELLMALMRHETIETHHGLLAGLDRGRHRSKLCAGYKSTDVAVTFGNSCSAL